MVSDNKRLAGLILLVSAVLTLAVPAHGQAVLRIDQRAEAELVISTVQEAVQRSRIGRVVSFMTPGVTVDGVPNAGQSGMAKFDNLLLSLPDRDVFMSNPRPDRLGPLWDFQIDAQYAFTDSSCQIECTFKLIAAGRYEAAGVIGLKRAQDSWQLESIAGLQAFLAAESDRVRRLYESEEGKRRQDVSGVKDE